MTSQDGQRGYALVTVLLLLALISALLVGYFALTSVEMTTTGCSLYGVRGFYAAEAGLNIRAKKIRGIFQDYRLPSGTAPVIGGTPPPCEGTNQGTGDLGCEQYALREDLVTTFVEETAGNPVSIAIPRGEPFQNIKAQEYRYIIDSDAEGRDGRTQAVLEMRLKSRLVPLFQFVAFYGKDLEILPGPVMTLSGPVHTNGDLYLDPGAQLDIHGQVTTAGDLYRGRKETDSCNVSLLQVIDPDSLAPLPPCIGGRREYSEADLAPWNGMVRAAVETVNVPPPEAFDPVAGELYWDRADLRIMLDLNGGPSIEARNADGSERAAVTTALASCAAATYSGSFYNNREGGFIQMLDIDVVALLNCLHAGLLMGGGKDIDDGTDGGLVWYLGVDGPDSDTLNSYGVRVRNGAELTSLTAGAPAVRGLSIVTNQAIYIQGDFNTIDKKPAAFLADSLNVLSNDWSDADSTLTLGSRLAASTTINAAFLSGTDTTGGVEGAAGQDSGQYNGGLENYPRFHEDWSGRTLRYRGSFVSLNEPRHVNGPWVYGDPYYEAPNRDWDYDTDFDDAANLPPLTPRFTYIRQDLLQRQFDR